ncbi:MAG TPA: serine/threonine-protein kinase [Jatrophihabitans sp.]|jgi:serine/threonine protein kinase|uniref:serine/threonine-protein kinase n=1 Tax=Jatrophihabitans sp. TaxID=1932789 RepID=UPI002F2267D9
MPETKRFDLPSGASYVWHEDQPIGRGGFSVVYEGEAGDGTRVAVKVIRVVDDGTSNWYTNAKSFGREIDIARRLAKVEVGHLMPLLDNFMPNPQQIVLVMPRADFSLAARLRDAGPLSEIETRLLLLDLMAGVEELAQAFIAHRDIKPLNVLRWRDRWVLADFGISKGLNDSTGSHTWVGHGSQQYWAPELFDAEPASLQSDLYAAGCTALEALMGHSPFPLQGAAHAHRFEIPAIPILADAALDRALRMLLAKNPNGRPEDPRQVRQILSPPTAITDLQKSLQRIVSRSAARAQEAEVLARMSQQSEQNQENGLARWAAIWDDIVELAQHVVPDATAMVQPPNWFLNIGDARLSVSLTSPVKGVGDLIGEISVRHYDHQRVDLLIAGNLRCVVSGGSSSWELLTFSRNDMARGAPRLREPVNGAEGTGVPLSALEDLLLQVDSPKIGMHYPVVQVHRQNLTGEAIVAMFVAEVDALEA